MGWAAVVGSGLVAVADWGWEAVAVMEWAVVNRAERWLDVRFHYHHRTRTMESLESLTRNMRRLHS